METKLEVKTVKAANPAAVCVVPKDAAKVILVVLVVLMANV
jgi:hypothetical protein